MEEIIASEYETEYRFRNLSNWFEIDLNCSIQTCTAGIWVIASGLFKLLNKRGGAPFTSV